MSSGSELPPSTKSHFAILQHVPVEDEGEEPLTSSICLLQKILRQQTPKRAQEELQCYKCMQSPDFNVRPLTWWGQHKVLFPRLYKLAVDVLSSNCSSAAVEDRVLCFPVWQRTLALRLFSTVHKDMLGKPNIGMDLLCNFVWIQKNF